MNETTSAHKRSTLGNYTKYVIKHKRKKYFSLHNGRFKRFFFSNTTYADPEASGVSNDFKRLRNCDN